MSGERKQRRLTTVVSDFAFSIGGASERRAASGAGTSAAAAAACPREPPRVKPEVKQLEAALQQLRRAERAQKEADDERAKAVKLLGAAVPAAVEMVRGATETLSKHEVAAAPSKALRAEQADAQARSDTLAGEVCQAVSQLAQLPAKSVCRPSVASARGRGAAFLTAVREVSGHLGQLHATLAASAAGANDGRSLVLRVLGIDQIRTVMLANLSLRRLFAVRRVCRDFESWSRAEVALLPRLPMDNIGEFVQTVTFDRGLFCFGYKQHLKVPPAFATMIGSALATSADGKIFLAGGDGDSSSGGDDSTCGVSVWRPAGHGGQWHALPPLPTALSGAKACTVTMADGEEVLAIASDDDSGSGIAVMVLRKGNWAALKSSPTYRRDKFSVCALPGGRLAIAGGRDRSYEGMTDVEVLDVAANSWTALPKLSQSRTNPGMVACGGNLFVLGGGAEEEGEGLNELELFSSEQLATDGSDDEWSEIATMSPTGEVSAPATVAATESVSFCLRKSLVSVQQSMESWHANNKPGTCLRLYDLETGRWYSKEYSRF